MTEMVEPDRTIIIVSIIGLVVIWGGFFYHKFVQDGRPAVEQTADAAGTPGEGGTSDAAAAAAARPTAAVSADPSEHAQGTASRKGKKRGKKHS
jgi:hypothetical protein